MHMLRLMLLWLGLLPLLADAGVPAASELSAPVKNYQVVSEGIATSGTLTRDDLAALQQQGIEQIIDLRRPEEGIAAEQEWSRELRLDYANFPVGRSLPDDQLIVQIGELLDQADERPTLMHCGSGHRAGIVLALYLHRKGTPADQAIAQAQAAGTRESAIDLLRQRMSEAE